MKHLLLTGASGFVGINVLGYVLMNTDWVVTTPITTRHHGRQHGISSIMPIGDNGLGEMLVKYRDRLEIAFCDLSISVEPSIFQRFGIVDYVWNIASESHVDRSLTHPVPFVRNNVELMINLLEWARINQPRLFLHMSTDEVYGAVDGHGALKDYKGHPEWSPIIPSNPYSASKAMQEALAISYWRSFNVPLIITNTMNLVGPWQDPEKFVPKTIKALRDHQPVEIHVDHRGVSGSRCWVHADDFAAAWHAITLAYEGRPDHVTYYPDMPDRPIRYNIAGGRATNEDVARTLAHFMECEHVEYREVDFHSSRPGHDMHYALDSTMFEGEFLWDPRGLGQALADTLDWYQDHPEFLG